MKAYGVVPRFVCWLFGHKRRTKHNFYGIVSGRVELEIHKTCPRCGEPL